MTSFLADWSKAKKDFTVAVAGQLKAGGAAFPADVRQEVVAFLKAETGLTPALKEVDAAFGKKHRKSVMQGLTKLHAVIEKSAMQAQKVAFKAGSKVNDVDDDEAKRALGEIQMLGLDFKRVMTGFEPRIAKDLEKLQEEKSADGVKIDIISLEGDMNGAIAKFKSDTKAFGDIEKKLKMLGAVEPAVKAMQAYSKAAARTEVKAAITALTTFNTAVEAADKHRTKVSNGAAKADDNYLKAADSLCAALRAITSQRGKDSLRNLQKLEADGAA